MKNAIDNELTWRDSIDREKLKIINWYSIYSFFEVIYQTDNKKV